MRRIIHSRLESKIDLDEKMISHCDGLFQTFVLCLRDVVKLKVYILITMKNKSHLENKRTKFWNSLTLFYSMYACQNNVI